MKHEDFKIGLEFRCGSSNWRVTDIGTRTVVAVELGRDATWYVGPPYAVDEVVFDENDFPVCEVQNP